ncbi:unnamed protein product, partial [marine sediment metagenome]
MNRHLMLGTLLAVVLVGAGAAPAGYMEFVSATPIDYEGTPAWEYYYDVYSDGMGSATQIWLYDFDANDLLNPLNQRWDGSAADGWGEGYWGEYPSIGDGDPGGTDLWVLTGNVGEMLNPIHPPSAYLPEMRNAMMWAGDITGDDELHYWYSSYVQYASGLYMTIRLVHPLGPGTISYSIIGPFSWEQDHAPITGPVPEPMTLSLLAVGAAALIRRRRR